VRNRDHGNIFGKYFKFARTVPVLAPMHRIAPHYCIVALECLISCLGARTKRVITWQRDGQLITRRGSSSSPTHDNVSCVQVLRLNVRKPLNETFHGRILTSFNNQEKFSVIREPLFKGKFPAERAGNAIRYIN